MCNECASFLGLTGPEERQESVRLSPKPCARSVYEHEPLFRTEGIREQGLFQK